MSATSDGSVRPGKRKSDENSDFITPVKMAAKYTRSRRGHFKDYNHIYVDNDRKEYTILLSSSNDKNTKMDILKVNNVLKNTSGVIYVKQVGPALVKVFFGNKSDANTFLLNKKALEKLEWVARIPYNNLESLGIIRAPVDISEEDLLENLKTSADIIGVKRFNRKTSDDSWVPTPTVLLTFLSSSAPDHVTFDHIWFDVKQYVKPLLQCFTCYKFGHSRGSCKSRQICSICSLNHFYKDCDNRNNVKCVNCAGAHTAVSALCPQKAAKVAEIKDKIKGNVTYATVAAKEKTTFSSPSKQVPSKRALMSDVINSVDILGVMIKTIIDVVKLHNVKDTGSPGPICAKSIKELLITNFAANNG